MKTVRITFVIVLTAFLPMGCGLFPTPNPLKGWTGKQTAYSGCPYDKVICNDYRSYIEELPEDERMLVTDVGISFYEKGAGERAVAISFAKNGKYWVHLLIYNNNVRIRVTKYVAGRYVS